MYLAWIFSHFFPFWGSACDLRLHLIDQCSTSISGEAGTRRLEEGGNKICVDDAGWDTKEGGGTLGKRYCPFG